jgi:hypothetical protein
MIYNQQCFFCGNSIYRGPSEERQSKSGLFFCSRFCKNLSRGENRMLSVPQNNPIFNATANAYNKNRTPEYIVKLTLCNTGTYVKQLGPYLVTAIARVNGQPNLSGKTPQDMEYIRDCFDKIKILDILALPYIKTNNSIWKKIHLKYWNPDVTYEVEK